jgi:GR25 family glycosyltransferase involved in LPS biosynthesis
MAKWVLMQDVFCYAINRACDVDRRHHLMKQVNALAPEKLQLVSAVVPNSEEYDRMMTDGTIACNRIVGPRRQFFKTGELGHYLSMAKMFDLHITSQDHRHLMMLEDDVVFPADFLLQLTNLRDQLPSDWDVLSLSWSKDGVNEGDSVGLDLVIPHHIASYQRRNVFIGTECVLFHHDAIQRIRSKMFPIQFQSDKFLDSLKNVGYIQLFAPVHPVTKQHESFPSTIGWHKK